MTATYDSPGTGIWFVCRDCDFAGDTIDYVGARFKDNRSTESVLVYMSEKGYCQLDDAATDIVIAEYTSRKDVESIIQRVKTSLCGTDFPDDATTLLFSENAYTGKVPFRWKNGRTDMFGYATSEMLFDLLSFGNKKSIDNFLVLFEQDIPGRVCGIHLLGRRGKSETIPLYVDGRPGLIFFSKIPPEYYSLVACRSPRRLLPIAARWGAICPDIPFPGVSFPSDGADALLMQLPADRIVFWEEPSIEIIDAAWKIPNARISTYRLSYDAVSSSCASMLHSVISTSVPVMDMIIAEVVSRSDLGIEILDRYSRDSSFIRAVTLACRTKAEAEIITDAFSLIRRGSPFPHVTLSDGTQISAMADGYWVYFPKKGTREQLTNFTVSNIRRLIPHKELDPVSIQMDISINGSNGTVELPDDNKKFIRALRRNVAGFTTDVPTVMLSSWSDRLLVALRSVHGIVDCPVFHRVGWNKRREHFVLPKIVISSSGVMVSPYAKVPPGCPAENIDRLSAVQFPDVDPCFWKLAAYILSGMLAGTIDAYPKNIVCVSPAGIGPLQPLFEALGLLGIEYSQMTRPRSDIAHPHGLPVVVDSKGPAPRRVNFERLCTFPYHIFLLSSAGKHKAIDELAYVTVPGDVAISPRDADAVANTVYSALQVPLPKKLDIPSSGYAQLKVLAADHNIRLPDSFLASSE